MPIQQVRQKSKTEAFGDIFSGVMGGLLQGKQLKRRQGMEDRDRAMRDALRIWQMAQQDPLIMQNPQVPKIFANAGLPMPAIREPMSVEQAFKQAPEGYEAIITVDPRTGTEKTTYKPKDWSSDFYKIMLMQQYPELFPNGEPTPAPPPLPTPPLVPDQGILPPLEEQLGKGRPSQPSEPFIGPPTPPGFVNQNWFAPAGRDIGQFVKPTARPSPKAGYKIGQIIPRGGQRYKVVGFDTDGEPLVEKI